jgi:hypothetical protein
MKLTPLAAAVLTALVSPRFARGKRTAEGIAAEINQPVDAVRAELTDKPHVLVIPRGDGETPYYKFHAPAFLIGLATVEGEPLTTPAPATEEAPATE